MAQLGAIIYLQNSLKFCFMTFTIKQGHVNEGNIHEFITIIHIVRKRV